MMRTLARGARRILPAALVAVLALPVLAAFGRGLPQAPASPAPVAPVLPAPPAPAVEAREAGAPGSVEAQANRPHRVERRARRLARARAMAPRVARRSARQVRGPARARVVMSRGGRAYLGVTLVNISRELREFYGAPRDAGVLVSRVAEESPAAAAGLAVGDVITAVEGSATEHSVDVVRQMGRLDPEEVVEIELVRAGAPLTLSATLGESERAVWFTQGFAGPDLDVVLSERLPEIVSGETQEAMRRAFEEARERMGEFDFAALADRLAEAEDRLRELEKKLAEKEP